MPPPLDRFALMARGTAPVEALVGAPGSVEESTVDYRALGRTRHRRSLRAGLAGVALACAALVCTPTAPAAATAPGQAAHVIAAGPVDAERNDGGNGGVVGSGGGLLCCLFFPLGIVLLLTTTRRRQRAARMVLAPSPHDQFDPLAGQAGPVGMEGDQLQREVEAALVDLDDAIRSSAEELAHADAQLGSEAVRPFREALDQARSRAADAFHLLRRLHDDAASGRLDAAGREARLREILGIAAEADRTLDAREGELERLRSLEVSVPRLLDGLRDRAEEVRTRIPEAEREMASLSDQFGPSAVGTVRGNVEQARRLLESARGFLSAAQTKVTGGDRAGAVAPFRAAEEAVGQADGLVAAVARAREDLTTAGDRIDEAIASLSVDLADADRLRAGDARTRTAAAEARAAIEAAQTARDGGDPLAALRRLVRAEQDLDDALVSHREGQAQGHPRGLELLDERISQVGARLEDVDAHVQSRRGAIGPEARSHLAEADRLFREALDRSATDPAGAVLLLDRAEEHGELALAIAEGEVDAWVDPRDDAAYVEQFGTVGIMHPGALLLGGIFGGALGGTVVTWGSRGGGWGGVTGGFGGPGRPHHHDPDHGR